MLKLSTKGRYATRIMLALALASEHRATKTEIARSEGISADYVEQILMKLKGAGLVRSRRGVNGGFSLTREPEKIIVSQVLEAAEGPLSIVPCCLPTPTCPRAGNCAAHTLWTEANEALEKIFSGVTLADMVKRTESMRDSTGWAGASGPSQERKDVK
jgi:Rrf2 family protein